MTVSYTGDVANASNFGIFVKILYKWKGSVYKLVYKELLAYILCYFVINITYRTVIVENSETCDENLPSCRRYIFRFSEIPCTYQNIYTIFLFSYFRSDMMNSWTAKES